jgi:hypothetical protein
MVGLVKHSFAISFHAKFLFVSSGWGLSCKCKLSLVTAEAVIVATLVTFVEDVQIHEKIYLLESLRVLVQLLLCIAPMNHSQGVLLGTSFE